MNIKARNFFIHILSLTSILFFSSTAVFAAGGGAGAPGITNPLGGTNSLSAFFNGIVTVVIELGTIVSVLGIMYGGFLYATAQGDEEKLGKAYKTVTWALVGTAILLGARTIMAVVAGTVEQLGTN